MCFDEALSIVSLYKVNMHNFDKLSSSSENKRYATKLNNVFLANKVSGVLSTMSWSRIKVQVNQSPNRPGVAQRGPGGLGSKIFMTFGT